MMNFSIADSADDIARGDTQILQRSIPARANLLGDRVDASRRGICYRGKRESDG